MHFKSFFNILVRTRQTYSITLTLYHNEFAFSSLISCDRSFMKKVLSVFIFAFILFSGFAQQAPELRCLAVQPDGSVVATWLPATDPNDEFEEYQLNVSQNLNGPYNATTVVPMGTTDTNFTPDIANSTEYYFITAVYNTPGGPVELYSETLRVIMPNIIAQTDTTAGLEWNTQKSPNLPSNSGEYEVFRRIGTAGPWDLRGTANYGDEEFEDDGFKVCRETIQYKVETADNSGCRSVSKVAEEVFEDIYPPDIPDIDSVTIDTATGNISLSWSESQAPDTRGYQILFWDQGWIIVDSVFGKPNTTYIDSLASGFSGAQRYTVAAFDLCERGLPPTANVSPGALPAHQSIFVQANPDFCEARIELEWSKYEGWNGPDLYEIHYNVNGGPFALLTTVPGSDSTYEHTGIDVRQDICYVLVGRDDARSKTTTSNRVCPTGTGTVAPTSHYIDFVTVEENSFVKVRALIDSTIEANYYTLERAIDSAGAFMEVDREDFSGVSVLELEDEEAKVNQTDYWYKVVMYDSCDFPIAVSNLSKTMYLQGELDRDVFRNFLRWTSYEGWGTDDSNALLEYELYRILQTEHQSESVIYSPGAGGDLSFDESPEEFMSAGRLCYRVRALNNMNVESLSNTVCISNNTKVFIPNAFRPDGVHNPIFKPVVSFGDLTGYEMRIYNRFGNLIYESNSLERGWDGKRPNGNDAQAGVYIYKITFLNQSGDETVEQGKVVLIR